MPDPEDAPCVDDSPKPKRVPWRKHTFDPDFLADLRRRYEQTSESINAIGRRAKVSQQTIRRYAQEGGWTRFIPPPTGFSPTAKLATETAELTPPEPSPPGAQTAVTSAAPDVAQLDLAQAARLTGLAALFDQQMAVLRAKQILPQRQDDARELTRMLGDLTTGASHIQHLINTLPRGPDDAPAPSHSDVDERRRAIARRIQEFIESRRGDGVGDAGERGGHRRADG